MNVLMFMYRGGLGSFKFCKISTFSLREGQSPIWPKSTLQQTPFSSWISSLTLPRKQRKKKATWIQNSFIEKKSTGKQNHKNRSLNSFKLSRLWWKTWEEKRPGPLSPTWPTPPRWGPTETRVRRSQCLQSLRIKLITAFWKAGTWANKKFNPNLKQNK